MIIIIPAIKLKTSFIYLNFLDNLVCMKLIKPNYIKRYNNPKNEKYNEKYLHKFSPFQLLITSLTVFYIMWK